jgi:hypothetical protein
MATKSKSQIITDINAKIITNGDIKATDTNAILKDILDCTELNGQTTTNLSTFSFKSKTALKDNRGATLSYSLKGIKDLFVNITFKIAILETNVNNLTFVHNDAAIAKALKSIISQKLGSQIDFLVKIESKQAASDILFRVGSLNFVCDNKAFKMKIDSQLPNDNLRKGDEVFASFAVHCPDIF